MSILRTIIGNYIVSDIVVTTLIWQDHHRHPERPMLNDWYDTWKEHNIATTIWKQIK